MIILQEGVWREDCVAGIDICDDQVQLYLVGNGDNYIPYDYDTEAEAIEAYKTAVTKWKSWFERKAE